MRITSAEESSDNLPVNYPRGSGKSALSASAPKTAPPPAPDDFDLAPPEDARARRRNAQIEYAEQCAYFDQVNAAIAAGRPGADMIYAVPNSNVAGPQLGVKLVKAGLRRGYPDINVDVPRPLRGEICHGLRIEMKKPSGVLSDVQPHQRQWHDRLQNQGFRVCVAFGWREALTVTATYLGWEDHPFYGGCRR